MRARVRPNPNVHVTLGSDNWFLGKKLPCPVCGEGMALRVARTQKPYCHCDPCGLQLFVRGRDGIQRLKQLLTDGVTISGAGRATSLLMQLETLKKQRERLDDRQSFFFPDHDLDRTIQIVDREIESVRRELVKLAND